VSNLKNETLKAAEDMIELRLKPGTRDGYLRLVVAAMDAAMHGGPDSILVSLGDSKQPVRDCAVAALDLSFRLRKQADHHIPLVMAVNAARALMVHALAFTEMAGAMTIGSPELLQATGFFNELIFARLKACNRSSHGATRTRGVPQTGHYVGRIERAVAAVVWLPQADPMTPPGPRHAPTTN